MMATEDPIFLPNDEAKEAEFSYFTSDIQDVQSKMERKSYFRTSSSEKSLLCLHSKEGEEFMRYKPRDITSIEEPDKKYLCVEYGPVDKPMYMLLNFNDSSESLEEWKTALRQMMGLENRFRDRSKSESVKRRPSTNMTNKPKRAVSTFQQQLIPEVPAENGLPKPSEDETVVDPHVFSGTTTDSPSSLDDDTRNRAGSDIDSMSITGSEVLSPFSSLKSEEGNEPWRRENELKKLQEERDKPYTELEVSSEELRRLTLSDYEGGVYASDVGANRPYAIYIGDKLLQVDSKSVSTAQEAMNLIRSFKQTQILVRLERFPKGNVCVIRSGVNSWPQLGIALEGNQITSTQLGEFRMSCDPAWAPFRGERSTRSISAINDHAVSLHSTTQEVMKLINEALQEEMSIVVFHVHPTEFLRELASSSSTNL